MSLTESFKQISKPSITDKEKKEEYRVLFGRQDLTDFYHKALKAFFDLKMNKLCIVNECGNRVEMVVCGIWKIIKIKHSDQNPLIKVERLDINTMVWEEKHLKQFPEILLLPHQSKLVWKRILEEIFWNDLFPMLGYYSLDLIDQNDAKGKLGRGTVAKIIVQNIFSKLNLEFMGFAMMAFRRELYKHIIDREFMRIVMSIHFSRLSLPLYAKYENNKANVQRIYKENQNLIVLLPFIHVSKWGRSDLFSQKLWVKGNRKRTALDTKAFAGVESYFNSDGVVTEYEIGRVYSFDDKSSFRWLHKAPHSVVNALYNRGGGDDSIKAHIKVLKQATRNQPNRFPVILLRYLIYSYSPLHYNFNDNHNKISRVMYLYIKYVAEMWKERGYQDTKAYIKQGLEFSSVLDWFRAEGHHTLPIKSTTWAGMVKLSNDWHQAIIEKKFEARNKTWEIPFKEIELDDFSITALQSRAELHKEGKEMHHCVSMYSDMCIEGEYMVFSIKHCEFGRSTLGAYLSNGVYSIQQHRGYCNEIITPKEKEIGERLIRDLNAGLI